MKKSLSGISRMIKVLWISALRYQQDDLGRRSVALTYYTVFAIVPLAALLFGIAKGFDLDQKLQLELTERFAHHKELLGYVYKFADTTLERASGGLVAGIGVIALIWTVMWLATNIEHAFNAVWGLKPRRNILRRFSDYLAVLLLTPALLVAISSGGVVIRNALDKIASESSSLAPVIVLLMSILADITPALIAIIFFFLVYMAVPNTKIKWRSALFAGIAAGIAYQFLQDIFLFMQSSIYTYNHIYGSFAALPLFLIWMQWSWQIALFGAEVGFVSQKYDSGLFLCGSKSTPPSERLRTLRKLAVCRLIYSKMHSGRGETSFAEIMDYLNISAIDIEREIIELENAGIIARVATQNSKFAFLPAKPTDSFDMVKCIKLLALNGNNEIGAIFSENNQDLDCALDKLLADAETNPANLPLGVMPQKQ
jgi:membrane protein